MTMRAIESYDMVSADFRVDFRADFRAPSDEDAKDCFNVTPSCTVVSSNNCRIAGDLIRPAYLPESCNLIFSKSPNASRSTGANRFGSLPLDVDVTVKII
jgi:hypothetical protein